jgi:hypothetical protein
MKAFTQAPKARVRSAAISHDGQISPRVENRAAVLSGLGNRQLQQLLTQTPATYRGLPALRRDPGANPLLAHTRSASPSATLGASGDRFERDADRIAERALRSPNHKHMADGSPWLSPASAAAVPAIGMDPLAQCAAAGTAGGGRPLDPGTRGFFESRLNHDFGDVRVHTDASAARAANALGANAYVRGRDVVFDRSQFAPHTPDGKRLLAHELAHVVQQRAGGAPTVQRDLKAYNKEKTTALPAFSMMGGSSASYETKSAEAPGLRAALQTLITDGKVKEVLSSDGAVSWFAAEHHMNAQLSEIEQALQVAGYAKATKLAKAIYDIHGEFLYSKESLTTIAAFYSNTTTIGEKVRAVTNRSMTEWEIRQAKRVFGNAINYGSVTIADGSVSSKIASVGGYARTIGNVINFPTGSSRSMAFMIHELTHVWQYQKTGVSYIAKALWAQVTEGYSYSTDGKSAEDSLKDARAAGKTLYDYNLEQQGDIMSDYYGRLQRGEDASAWQSFIDDVK